jgi:hypothetical protein
MNKLYLVVPIYEGDGGFAFSEARLCDTGKSANREAKRFVKRGQACIIMSTIQFARPDNGRILWQPMQDRTIGPRRLGE